MSIQLHEVSKRYGKRSVLEQFSAVFPARGIIGLSGPSGCGKTTLLRLLAGLESPDSGSVAGVDHLRISMVFQEDRLLPWLSLIGNLAVVQSDPTVVRYYLECMQLSEHAHVFPEKLSGGMQRRAALARSLCYGGDLFLLDEPFKGLDHALREQIMPHIADLGKNSLVLIVSHDENELLTLSDSVFELKGPPLQIKKGRV